MHSEKLYTILAFLSAIGLKKVPHSSAAYIYILCTKYCVCLFQVISREDSQCTCSSTSEQRISLLFCCIRDQTPCSVHTKEGYTEAAKLQPRIAEARATHSLSLLQRLRKLLCDIFRKDQGLESKQKDNLHLEVKADQIETDIKEKGIDCETVKADTDIYYTEDDLVAVAQRMVNDKRHRSRRRPKNGNSKDILKKYANYDENRERIAM